MINKFLAAVRDVCIIATCMMGFGSMYVWYQYMEALRTIGG